MTLDQSRYQQGLRPVETAGLGSWANQVKSQPSTLSKTKCVRQQRNDLNLVYRGSCVQISCELYNIHAFYVLNFEYFKTQTLTESPFIVCER